MNGQRDYRPASYALVGVDEHDRIELPKNLHQVLKRVVEAMSHGRAVTAGLEQLRCARRTASRAHTARPIAYLHRPRCIVHVSRVIA